MVNLYSKSNGFDGVYAICSFVILNLFSFSFVESYSIQNILLFIILFIAQIIYKDKIAINITLISFLVWLLCYYYNVYPLNIYYTPEQTFTDSNYYDFYALKFSKYDIERIMIESNITWQSVYVITFYSIIYKFFGLQLLNPIIINLILIYFSFYNIRVNRIKGKNLYFILFLIPFIALNAVVPGKDVIMIFLMSIYLSTFIRGYSKTKSLIIKFIIIFLGFLNRPNSLPIFLLIELISYNNLSKKLKYIVNSLVVITVSLYPFFAEKLIDVLGFSNRIDIQRDGFTMSESLINLFLPDNILLYVLVTPIRTLAYLVSPFPLFNRVLLLYNDVNFFSFWFVLFKFISGFIWFLFIYKFFINKKFKYNAVINVLLVLPVFISAVSFVQGGRYRIFCDFVLIFYFTINNNNNNNNNENFNNKSF